MRSRFTCKGGPLKGLFTSRLIRAGMLGALSVAAFPASADVERGRELHQTHCISCHAARFGGDGRDIYLRPGRRVNSLDGLRKQVKLCETNLGLTWFDDQIDDVVEYLDTNFYRLKK